MQFESMVVETTSPLNPGDSGGPVVNDRGELVAVTEGGSSAAMNTISILIDVSEVIEPSLSPIRFRTTVAPSCKTTCAVR